MDERSIPIEGTCDPAFAAVRDVFEQNFRKRNEIGAAVCVYRDGKKVVDLWGGHNRHHEFYRQEHVRAVHAHPHRSGRDRF